MTPARRRPIIPCRQACRDPATGGLLPARAADPCLTVPIPAPMPPEPSATCAVIRRAARPPRTRAAFKAPPSS